MTRVTLRDKDLGLLVFVGQKFIWFGVSPKDISPDENWLTLDGKRVVRVRNERGGRQTILDERDRVWEQVSIDSVDTDALNGSCAAPHCGLDAEEGHYLCLSHGKLAE